MSGSSAEFYIKPALSCIGDFDFMACDDYSMAIPSGFTPPTELPAHFQRILTVYEIIDSHQPGYVYLKPSYIIKKNDEGRYVVHKKEVPSGLLPRFFDLVNGRVEPNSNTCTFMMQCFREPILLENVQNNSSVQLLKQYSTDAHGPALQATIFLQEYGFGQKINEITAFFDIKALSSIDIVRCIRCLLWPTQAAEWPKRSRNQGWPNIATVNSVVINGCDVVQAVHQRYKQDEWTNKYQWRLSFSRAEVTLLNSWTPVYIQQMVYHMLRFVLKREVLSNSDDSSRDLLKLNNYHVKTLMLWECERKPQRWWSVESSLVKLCSSLLQKLCDWVSDKYCQHYLVSKCNLLDHFVEDAFVICNSLKRLADVSVLLNWFVENYIGQVAHSCPAEVSTLFEDIRTTCKLGRAVNIVTDWKSKEMPFNDVNKLVEFYMFEALTLHIFQIFRIQALTRKPLRMNELKNPFPRRRCYTIAVVSLRVAFTTSIHGLSEDLLEVLWTLFDPCDAAMTTSSLTSGELMHVRKAVKLATLSSVRSNALEMLHNETSKAYLHHSFTHGLESTYRVVHVLLAVLYYKSLHYQAAIDHCKQVLKRRDREQDSVHSIGAEYLPQIDERVDTVFGLIVLYQHAQRSSREQLQLHSMRLPALTIELLARYLHSQCSTTINAEGDEVTAVYRQHLFQSRRPLLSDVLLLKAVEIQVNKCTKMPVVKVKAARDENNGSGSMDTTLLVTTLEQVALEKLIAVRRQTIRELSSQRFPFLNEFEVLYAYKCGLIEECLEICRTNISTILGADVPRDQQRYFTTFPELLSLLDGELVSLFGIIQLSHPTTYSVVPELDRGISLLTMSLYLMVQCLMKFCRYPPVQELQLIRFVHDQIFHEDTGCDRLVLKLNYRLLKLWAVRDRRDHRLPRVGSYV